MSKTTSMIALALFLGMAPTVAISQTQAPQPEPPAAQQPDTGTQMNNQSGTQDSQSTQTQPSTPPDPTTTQTQPSSPDTSTQAETPTTPAPAPQAESPKPAPDTSTQAEVKESQPDQEQIVLQDADSILASSMIGTSVYAPNDEVIGDINDIIVNTDGTVQGVVIGVGGFLGLGEKDVAVTMKSLTLTPERDGSAPRLVLNSTKEELEAAPEFKSAADQASETSQPSTPAPAPAN